MKFSLKCFSFFKCFVIFIISACLLSSGCGRGCSENDPPLSNDFTTTVTTTKTTATTTTSTVATTGQSTNTAQTKNSTATSNNGSVATTGQSTNTAQTKNSTATSNNGSVATTTTNTTEDVYYTVQFGYTIGGVFYPYHGSNTTQEVRKGESATLPGMMFIKTPYNNEYERVGWTNNYTDIQEDTIVLGLFQKRCIVTSSNYEYSYDGINYISYSTNPQESQPLSNYIGDIGSISFFPNDYNICTINLYVSGNSEGYVYGTVTKKEGENFPEGDEIVSCRAWVTVTGWDGADTIYTDIPPM